MELLWIGIAFALGFAVSQIKLPPLLGFLAAGFVLNAMGVEGSEKLDDIADLGVLLLLFSIGLKLKIKDLFQPMIWAGTTIHMVFTILIISLGLFIFSLTGLSELLDISLFETALIAFALSFSSTVFAVKILEENKATSTMYGKIAIGVLVMQDIIAVIFLTFSSGKAPSPWALVLILLLFLPQLLQRFPLSALLNRSGHGELLVLLGILIPIGGAYLFESVGLKPDLGALVFGVLMSNHPKAKELSKSMLSFKDLFLVGFFLTIGLSGIPTIETFGIALILTLILLPFKIILYFLTLVKFKLRARTAALSSLSLANYSEFGLIVGAAGMANGWLDKEWLVIFALALTFSFVLASPLNLAAHKIYMKFQKKLLPFESNVHLPEDEPIEFSNEEVIVFGMGRTGNEVYEVMKNKYGKSVLGIDVKSETIQQHHSKGKKVIQGDATDIDFWQRINFSHHLPIIILATSSHTTHMIVIRQLKEIHCDIKVAAISRYDDELEELRKAGVEVVFNLYTEAGAGFADHSYKLLCENG